MAYLIRSICRKRHEESQRTIAVSGEAGLGKTRLVNEAIHGARFREYQVLSVRATELEREIPLNSLLEALSQSFVGPLLRGLPEPWRSHLLSLFPQFRKGSAPVPDIPFRDGEGVSRRTCEAFLLLIEAVAASAKTVLFIDDFHWADSTSATVLHFIHRRWQRGDFTLVLTYRPDAIQMDHPHCRFLDDMETSPHATRIRLRDLDSESARRLAGSCLADQMPERVLDEITELADGNPLFLIELTADYLANPAPPGHESDTSVPLVISKMIRQKISRLDPVARKVMFALAVLEPEATLNQVSLVTAFSVKECVGALEGLRDRRLLKWTGGVITIRYEILRRAIYKELSPVRKAMLHRAIAEMLISHPGDRPLDKVALHYCQAGERELAFSYAMQAVAGATPDNPVDRSQLLGIAYKASRGPDRAVAAAHLAHANYDSRRLAEALQPAREAIKGAGALSPLAMLGVELLVADARYLLELDPPQTTLERLSKIEASASEQGEEVLLAKVLDLTLQVLHGAGDIDGVDTLLAKAEQMLSFKDPAARCRVLGTLAVRSLYGSPEAGLAASREAVGTAKDAGLHGEMMFVMHRHILALTASGALATEEGRAAITAAMEVARNTDDVYYRALMLFNLASWHISFGCTKAASKVLHEAMSLASQMDCPKLRFLETVNMAALMLTRGDLARARSILEQARQRGRTHLVPPRYIEAMVAAEGNLLLETGKLAKVVSLLKRHSAGTAEETLSAELALFHARLRSRQGDPKGAMALLEKTLVATETSRPLCWLKLALELVRLARRRGQPRPDLAKKSRARAEELCLHDVAHEFLPFVD